MSGCFPSGSLLPSSRRMPGPITTIGFNERDCGYSFVHRDLWRLWVPAFVGTTAGIVFATPSARSCENKPHPPIRGRREDRVRAAPAVSCAMRCWYAAHEHTGLAETPGLPCAMALRLIRFRPGDRAVVTPSSANCFRFRQLDACIGASDPNDFAVRLCCARQSQQQRPSLPCPAFATMADAPLVGQDGGSYGFDLPDEASGLFLRAALDRFLLICPSG